MAYFWPPPRCRRSKDGFLMYQRKILEKKNKRKNPILFFYRWKHTSKNHVLALSRHPLGYERIPLGNHIWWTTRGIFVFDLKNVLKLFKNFVKIYTIYRKDIIIAKYKLTIVKLLLLVVLQGLMWSALKQYLFGILKSTHGGQDQSKIFFLNSVIFYFARK